MAFSVFETTLKGKKMVIPASLQAIDPARDAFEDFLNDAGISHEDCHLWLLVFTEALVNAIRHGSDSNPDREVIVSWTQEADRVRLSIQDSGPGPDPKRVEALALHEDGNPESTSGRGLFLIDHFCDSWEHWRGPDGYMQVLTKSHPGIATPEAHADGGILQQALAEISLCYESLAAFYQLGDALIHSNSVAKFIGRALGDLKHVVPCDHFFVSVSLQLQQSVRDELAALPFTIDAADPAMPCVIRTTMEEDREFFWDSTEADEWNAVTELGSPCGLSVPIRAGSLTLGAVLWLRSDEKSPFNAAQMNTVRTFADLFGIAIANANHAVVRTRENQALKELEIASTIQDTLLPTSIPSDYDAHRLLVRRISAREVSGDYAEALRSPNGSLYLIIVDVMGKGVPAAFLAVMIRTAVRILLESDHSLNDFAHKLNHIICGLVGDMTLFATVAIAKIDRESTHIDMINAGHSNVLLFPRFRDGAYNVSPSGPPMGLFTDATYPVETFFRNEIESILMVTDGIFEWEKDGEVWGWEAFYSFALQERKLPPQAFWDSLMSRIGLEADSDSLADDQTCILWKNHR